MSERATQGLTAFLTGLGLIEIPIVIGYLTVTPQPDWKIMLAGLLGGLLTFLKRWLETRPAGVTALHQETYRKAGVPIATRRKSTDR